MKNIKFTANQILLLKHMLRAFAPQISVYTYLDSIQEGLPASPVAEYNATLIANADATQEPMLLAAHINFHNKEGAAIRLYIYTNSTKVQTTKLGWIDYGQEQTLANTYVDIQDAYKAIMEMLSRSKEEGMIIK